MPTLLEVEALDNYQIWVRYDDGVAGVADLSDLAGDGVFALWNDYQQFRKVRIGPGGELAWSDQIDICPDAIYLRITGKSPGDLFPKLRELPQYAGD